MSKLPENFEKDYLELLHEYSSEETRKTRRNILVASFLIVAAQLAGLSILDLRLFADLRTAHKNVVLLIAVALLMYWLAMYGLYVFRDSEIQKERGWLLAKLNEDFKKRLDELETQAASEIKQVGHMMVTTAQEIGPMRAMNKRYTDQQERLRRASKLQRIVKGIEHWLPALAGLVAIGVLVCELL